MSSMGRWWWDPPAGQPARVLPRVSWAGLELMRDDPQGFSTYVIDVPGWYSTSEPETGDVPRALSDGALYGPLVRRAKEITIEGRALGGRADLMDFRDRLAGLAAGRTPTELTVDDPWLERSLVATVRSMAPMLWREVGHTGATWSVTVRAADPRFYGVDWYAARLDFVGSEETGRRYPRTYPWRYASPQAGGFAALTNAGSAPAPVFAVWHGGMERSRLTDGHDSILMAYLANDEEIVVNTETLVASAAGGVNRASYLLAGSRPLTVPARASVTWELVGSGRGFVELNWRDAWL